MYEHACATLERSIEDLEIRVDGAALTHCFALLDRFTAKVTMAVGAFDRAEVWRDDAATSMTNWLRTHTQRSGKQAQTCARTARRLQDLPAVAQAYVNGRLSSGQVQAIVVNLNDKTTPLFAEQEAELLPTLTDLSVNDLSTVMQEWAARAKDQLDEPEPTQPERTLHISKTLGGRRELSGSLDPEAGAIVETALRVAASSDVDGEPPRTLAQQRADALVDVMRWFLDHQTLNDGGRHRAHLNAFLDYEDLAGHTPGQPPPRPGDPPRRGKGGWLSDGTRLDQATIQRLVCDANIHRVVRAGRSVILDYGTSTRTISAALWAALVARDHHCRFPGCDRPAHWCEAHHLRHVEHSGPTNPPNLAVVCTRHHHLLHQPGWQVKLLPDSTLTVTTPAGRALTSHPPGRLHHLHDPP